MRESWRRCYLEVRVSTGIYDIYNGYSISVVYVSTIFPRREGQAPLPTKKGCERYNSSSKLKLKPCQTNLGGLGIRPLTC